MTSTIVAKAANRPLLHLVNSQEQLHFDADISCTLTEDSDGHPIALITIPRDERVLRDLCAHLGYQPAFRRVTPQSLTFAIDNFPPMVTSISDHRLRCVRRRDSLAVAG